MNAAAIEIGPFDASESDQLGIILFDSVRDGAASSYSADQRRVWAPEPPSGLDWTTRLASQRTLVARRDGRPVGFMTLADDGHIDLAYVTPSYQRRGVGRSLHASIEALARSAQIERLHTEASYLARGLFEHEGWSVVREQRVERGGVELTNFVMEKRLVDVRNS